MKPSTRILNDAVDTIVNMAPKERIKAFTNMAKQLKKKEKTAQYWRMTNLADKVGQTNDPDNVRKFSKQALILYTNSLKSKTKQKRWKDIHAKTFRDAGAKIVRYMR